MNKFWHWAGLVVLIFVCIYVYNQQLLKNVPLIGTLASA
jgi:hypothetical protein